MIPGTSQLGYPRIRLLLLLLLPPDFPLLRAGEPLVVDGDDELVGVVRGQDQRRGQVRGPKVDAPVGSASCSASASVYKEIVVVLVLSFEVNSIYL